MQLAIPDNLANSHWYIDGGLVKFIQETPRWRHVWRWDCMQGTLTLTQIKRGRDMLRTRQWTSGIHHSNIASARRDLREFGAVHWFGADAVRELHHALVRTPTTV